MPLDPYTGEEISNLPRLTVTPNPLPVEQPIYNIDPYTGNPIYADTQQAAIAPKFLKRLTGTGGEEAGV